MIDCTCSFRFQFTVMDFSAQLAVVWKDCADNSQFCMDIMLVAVVACSTSLGRTVKVHSRQFTLPCSHKLLLTLQCHTGLPQINLFVNKLCCLRAVQWRLNLDIQWNFVDMITNRPKQIDPINGVAVYHQGRVKFLNCFASYLGGCQCQDSFPLSGF